MTGDQLVGASLPRGETVVLTLGTAHGIATLAPDGSFTYLPAGGFVGIDSFWIAMSRGPVMSTAVEVVIRVVPSPASPSPLPAPTSTPAPGGDAFVVGATSRGNSAGPGVSFGTLGPLDFAFEWLIPGLIVTLPGLLLVLALLAQLLVGAGWLPLVRREIGDFGLRRRRHPGTPPA